MSSGKESALSSVYFTKTSAADYQELCSLDVLGLEDRPESDEQNVYSEFTEQLHRSEEGRMVRIRVVMEARSCSLTHK